MSQATPLEQLAAHATELHTGDRVLAPLDAVLAAHTTMRDKKFTHIGNEQVPFTALHAFSRRRPILVRLMGTGEKPALEYRFGKDAGEAVQVDDGHLVFVLAGDRKVEIPLQGTYTVQIDDDGTLINGAYDVAEARRSVGAPVDSETAFTVHLPIRGLVAERTANRHRLPKITLELQMVSKPAKAGKTGVRLYAVVVRVALRPSAHRSGTHHRRHLGTHPYARSSRRFFNGPEVALVYRAPAETSLSTASYASVAKQLFDAAGLRADDTYSFYVHRNERQLVAHESNGTGVPEVYALGDLTQSLAAIAIVDEVLRAHSRVAEVNLHSRDLLYEMLTTSGAVHVRDALLEVYTRGGETKLPSVAQLLTHTAGLPSAAGMGMHDMQAIIADKGGLAATGVLEQDFAAMLRNKVALSAPPGAAYTVSPLCLAILMFAMPGQDKSTAVVDALRALGASERTRFASSPADPAFQGVYRMYSGLMMDAASLARVLSHRTWIANLLHDTDAAMAAPPVVIAKRFDWLSQLLVPRVTVRAGEMARGYAGWTCVEHGDPPHHVVYASGRSAQDFTLALFLPAYGVSCTLAVRRRGVDTPYPASARSVVGFVVPALLSMIAPPGVELKPRLGSFPRLHFPFITREMALHAQRSDEVIAANGSLAPESPEVARYYSGTFVSAFDRDSTLSLTPRMTHPGPAVRYVATERRGPWTAEYEVVNDRERLPDPENPDAPRGGLRLVDPITHTLSDPVYLSLLRSEGQKQRIEPVIMFNGSAYVREPFAADIRAKYDEGSAEARARFAATQQVAKERAAHSARVNAERAARRRANRRDEDVSSDEDSDGDEDISAPISDSIADMEIINGDIFSALASSSRRNGGGGRATWGRWLGCIGTPALLSKAVTHAYPSGGRVYPMADAIAAADVSTYY